MQQEASQTGVLKMICEHFGHQHHQVEETRNNFFGSVKRNIILYHAKIDMHECHKRCCRFVALVLTNFHLTKHRVIFFRPGEIVASFLHLMVLICNVHQSLHKRIPIITGYGW